MDTIPVVVVARYGRTTKVHRGWLDTTPRRAWPFTGPGCRSYYWLTEAGTGREVCVGRNGTLVSITFADA